MKIYFSGGGVVGVWSPVNELIIDTGGSRLISFAYARVANDYCNLVNDLQVESDFLIDSGAFTAWTKNSVIDIDSLSSFFETNVLSIPYLQSSTMVNLDVIPGRKGVDPTVDEIEKAMIQSDKNYDILNSRFPGKIIPVYHQGEPIKYLNHLIDKTNHVCISPRNDVHEKQRVSWVSEVFPKNCLVHGLATTGNIMMNIVDWFSVDSATWIMVAATGSIFWKTPENDLRPVTVSAISGSVKVWDAHINTMNPSTRDYLIEEIHARGFDLENLSVDDVERYKWNYTILNSYIAKPNKLRQGVLF